MSYILISCQKKNIWKVISIRGNRMKIENNICTFPETLDLIESALIIERLNAHLKKKYFKKTPPIIFDLSKCNYFPANLIGFLILFKVRSQNENYKLQIKISKPMQIILEGYHLCTFLGIEEEEK